MIHSWEQWQDPLAESLLHFIWQGTLIACLVGGLFHLLRARSPELRYGTGLIGLLAMALAPVVTFYFLMPNSPANLFSGEAGFLATQPAEKTALAAPAIHVFAPASTPKTVEPKEPESYYAWIIAGWSIGVLLFGARLLCGCVGLYRWSWPRAAIPQEISDMVQRLTDALAMRVPRVFLSPRVPEALALGILRPMILIPAAWLTELSPPMLEAVLAHELAHLRRYDLWFNLLQRLVETLLFYHPAVWWLSARLRQERELCCDALAVSVTADHLTYARTLEQVARLAVTETRSGWAVTIGGNRMNLLNRVQRVLGIAPVPKSHRPWLAGIVALIVPPVLWLAMFTVGPTTLPAGEQKDLATGTVVDEQGKVVPDAKILALQDGDQIKELRADGQGQFKVPIAWRSNDLEDRRLVVREKGRLGWFILSRNSTDAAKKPDFRMILLPLTRQIQGELVDEKGNPLNDFPVGVESLSHKTNGLFYASYGGEEPFLPTAKTDATGRFKIILPATDDAGLRLLHLDRLALRLAVPKDKMDLGKIVVDPAGRIEGRVTDAKTGKPLAMAHIGAQYVGEGGLSTGAYGDAKSDKDGRFVIGGLPPGQYNASFFHQNPRLVAAAKQGVVVEAGKTVTVDFQVSEGCRLAGKLIDVVTGKPLPRFTVGCCDADRTRSCRMALTDDQGRFEFYVSPGPRSVYVAQGPQVGINDSSRTIEVLPNRDVTDLILQASTKDYADFGIFVGASDISPEEQKKRDENQDWRLRIRLRTPGGQPVNSVMYYWIRDGRIHTATGHFSGKHFDYDGWGESKKGIWTLLIDADGFNPVLTREFEYNKRMEPLVVDLEPAVYVPVCGRVVDVQGKPMSGARVRTGRIIVGQSKEFPWGVESTTDAQGQFELKRLRVGERLFLYADMKEFGGVESQRFLLERKEPFQVGDLQIPRAGLSLEGIVTDHYDVPLPGAQVTARDAYPRAPDQGAKYSAKADANGRFRFQGLLPGKVGLRVESPGYRMGRDAQETLAGKKDVHVELDKIPDPKKVYPGMNVELRPKNNGKAVKSEVWWLQVGKGVFWSTSWEGNQNSVGFGDHDPLKTGKTYALVIASEGFAWPKSVIVNSEKASEPALIELERAAPVALRGRVIDDNGQPLASVKIGLSRTLLDKIVDEPWRWNSDWKLSTFPITDAEGRFRIENLQPDCEVAVYVNKPGYAGAMSARTTLIRGPDTTLADIRLKPSERTISGVVLTDDGKPAASAKVLVHGFGNVETKTDANGKFELKHVPIGEILVGADVADYPLHHLRVKADENEVRITVRDEE